METLMHTCCAPCSVSCIRQLRGEGIEPVSFWYNPNIHPYQEYKARRDTLMAYAPAIGMILEGLPAGETIDMAALQTFLDRRAPGRNDWSTPRKEGDQPEFLSGLSQGRTCGAPLTAVIRNTNTRSGDYADLRDLSLIHISEPTRRS